MRRYIADCRDEVHYAIWRLREYRRLCGENPPTSAECRELDVKITGGLAARVRGAWARYRRAWANRKG